jgi:hypothetical protein
MTSALLSFFVLTSLKIPLVQEAPLTPKTLSAENKKATSKQ